MKLQVWYHRLCNSNGHQSVESNTALSEPYDSDRDKIVIYFRRGVVIGSHFSDGQDLGELKSPKMLSLGV